MSKDLFYPLDYTGQNPECKVEKEFQSVVTVKNTNRLIVPNAAPFYREGLRVVHWPSGKELKENTDYYLGYRYREMETTQVQQLFGAIVITNVGLMGTFELEYQTIGGNFVQPQPKVLEYLTNYLTNPRITDWERVLNKMPSYPVREHKYSHDDHVNLDDVEGELMGIRDAIEAYAESMGQETFDALTTRLNTLEAQMVASGLDAHQKDMGNPHNGTYQQIGALGANQTAVNAIKAFNRTLEEFVQYCYDNGVTQQDLDTLLPRATNHKLLKQLTLPTTSFIRSVDGSPGIDISGSIANLIMNGALGVQADSLLNGNGAASMEAGSNKLEVRSSGTNLDNDDLRYNGSVVVHSGNFKRHLVAIADSVYYIDTEDGHNTTMGGNGSTGSPLTVDGNLPDASPTVKGITTVTNVVSSAADKAAGASVMMDVNNQLRLKMPANVTLNGHAVRNSPNLTKSDIDLGNVDNTSDFNKPISVPQQIMLDEYIQANHTHNASDIYVPLGNDADAGYGFFSNESDPYTLEDGALSSITFYKKYTDETNDYLTNTDGGVPSDLLPIYRYGESDYLPIPATGYFGGAGFGGNGYAAVLEVGNRVVLLRQGRDVFTRRLYYYVCKLKSDRSGIEEHYPTTTTYDLKPPQHPTEQFITIRASCLDAAVLVTDGGNYYLVEFNGSMDISKHRATLLDGIPYNKMCDAHDAYYFSSSYSSSGDGCNVTLQRIAKAEMGGSLATVQQLTLSGFAHNGQWRSGTTFNYIGGGTRETSANGDNIYVTSDPFNWSLGIRHSAQNILLGAEGDKVRVYLFHRPYGSNSTAGRYGPYWDISFTIDIANSNRVTCDFNPDFPIRVDNNFNFTVGNLLSDGSGVYPGGTPNRTSFGNDLGEGLEIYNSNYGTHSNPAIYIRARVDSALSWFESLDKTVRGTHDRGSLTFLGDTFSGVSATVRNMQALIGNQFNVRTTNNALISRVDVNNKYEDANDGSFGFHPDFSLIDLATSERLMRVSYSAGNAKFDGTLPSDEAQRGCTWDDSGLTADCEWNGDFVRQSTIPQALWDSIRSKCKALAAQREPQLFLGDRMIITTFDAIGTTAWINYGYLTQNANGSKRSQIFLFRVQFNKLPDPTSITYDPVYVHHSTRFNNATGISVMRGNYEGAQCVKNPNGTWTICLGNGIGLPHVGNSTTGCWAFNYNSSGHAVTNIQVFYSYSYKGDGYMVVGSKGIYLKYDEASGTACMAHKRKWDFSEDTNGHVIWSSVAVGNWRLFISNDVSGYAKGQKTTLTQIQYDLQVAFPDTHQNNEFYIYFYHPDVGGFGYALRDDKPANSDDMTYLGYIRTDSFGISDVQIHPVLRWGELKELKDHEADRDAHGYGDLDRATFNLDLIENKEATEKLDPPTWSQVFNDWYRFSHGNTSNVVPYLPNELNEWSYDEATDSILCTINSSSRIGFVSPNPYTDYEFDTYVQSLGSDDDWIGVVLAFEIDENGGEHSLVLMRKLESQDSTATGDTAFIYHRYTSPENVVTTDTIWVHDGIPLPFGWNAAGRSRLHVERLADVYTVTVYSFEHIEYSDLDYIVAQLTIDLDDYPTMAIFKGSSRFGYVAQSQDRASWNNIVRPDSDGRSFYATNKLLRNAFDIHGNTRMQDERIAVDLEATGSSGTKYSPWQYYELPEGYTAAQCDVAFNIEGWDFYNNNDVQVRPNIRVERDESNRRFRIRYVESGLAVSNTMRVYMHLIVIGRPSLLA